jgi:hypothetical protein
VRTMQNYLRVASRIAGCVCLVALLSISSFSEEDVNDQVVLVWNGNSMVRRAVWTLKGIHVEWQYWFYKKGAPQIEKYHWGTESAETLADLKRNLHDSQELEKQYAPCCDFTWFNVKGPIASIRGVPPAIEATAKDIKEKAEMLHEIKDAVEKAEAMSGSGEVPGRPKPFSVTEEFLNLLVEAQERVNRVNAVLDKAVTLNQMMDGILFEHEDTLYHQLQLVTRDLQRTRESAQRLGIISPSHAKATPSMPVGAQDVEINGGYITQTISSSGATVSIVQNTTGTTQGQTYIVPKNDLQGARPSLRQQGNAWIVSVVLPRRSVQLQLNNGPEDSGSEVVSRVELFFNNEADARRAARQLTGIEP